MPKAKTRKRRCKICKKWFMPDVRHTDRQKTCGPECRTEPHRRQCAEYNRKNRKSSKADHLRKKLEEVDLYCRSTPDGRIDPEVARFRIDLDLPGDLIGGAIGLPLLVVIEYVVEQILRKRKIAEKTAGRKGRPAARAPCPPDTG